MLDFGFYNEDCMKGMKEFPDKYFDLAIVDPPYGINAGKMNMGSGKHLFNNNKTWDESIPSSDYFSELFRVSKMQVIWGGNYFTQYLKPSPHWLVWDKKNPHLSFAEGELAWMNDGNNLRIFHFYTVQQTMEGRKIHPTQKPIELYDWILRNYAEPGYKILDTHVGSASSLIACKRLNFDFVGFEIDKEYYRLACERIARETAQMTLTQYLGEMT